MEFSILKFLFQNISCYYLTTPEQKKMMALTDFKTSHVII